MFTPIVRTFAVAGLLYACASAPSLTEAERQAVTSEVTATLAQLTQAINDHDPDRAMAFYSDDPAFLFLGCTNYINGGVTFKRMVGPTYSPEKGATFKKQIVSLQALSPTSAVASQQGSSTQAPTLFWTRVLVKEQGRWVIVYEHQSWPGCEPPPAPHPYTMPSDSAGLLP